MQNQFRQALIAADNATDVQWPSGFNYQDSLARVLKVKQYLEEAIDTDFNLDDNTQDATYFSSLYILKNLSFPIRHNKVVLSLKFSCFGGLFTISIDPCFYDIKKSEIMEIIKFTESIGFIYVPDSCLDDPYDGPNPYFANTTWRHRFFDYL